MMQLAWYCGETDHPPPKDDLQQVWGQSLQGGNLGQILRTRQLAQQELLGVQGGNGAVLARTEPAGARGQVGSAWQEPQALSISFQEDGG